MNEIKILHAVNAETLRLRMAREQARGFGLYGGLFVDLWNPDFQVCQMIMGGASDCEIHLLSVDTLDGLEAAVNEMKDDGWDIWFTPVAFQHQWLQWMVRTPPFELYKERMTDELRVPYDALSGVNAANAVEGRIVTAAVPVLRLVPLAELFSHDE